MIARRVGESRSVEEALLGTIKGNKWRAAMQIRVGEKWFGNVMACLIYCKYDEREEGWRESRSRGSGGGDD